MFRVCLSLLVVFCVRPVAAETSAERGYRLLLERAYLPADFDQETFDQVWRVWPEPLRRQAASSTPQQRREMAFARYGLTVRPGDQTGKPLQYVVDEQGRWTMNCFACHGGTVNGQTYPGSPNASYALQTLTDEIRLAKLTTGKPLARMDIGSLFMPLGTTDGTTNAVMFGVALMAFREPDLTLKTQRRAPAMVHHDMDAPPWWHFRRKKNLYIDGFAPKGARPLMQFLLVEQNGPNRFRKWESDFHDILAYLESVRPPKYPHRIDSTLAERGRRAFNRVCSECHGTYGDGGEYPERIVDLSVVATDGVRLKALTPEHREAYRRSWFAHFGASKAVTQPAGYVAPPLDGVWASGPYFHNGSVPTLWHVLHPDERPLVWRRLGRALDEQRVGLQFESFDDVPASLSRIERRRYFDTRQFGKSAAGHRFGDELREGEHRAVLEYLKTL